MTTLATSNRTRVCRHFGGWRQAMRAAGFEPIKAESWSKQRIVERLRAWAERSDDTDLGTSEGEGLPGCWPA